MFIIISLSPDMVAQPRQSNTEKRSILLVNVHDQNGAVIVGVVVSVKSESGQEYTSQTNQRGEVLIENLAEARYFFKAEATGFDKFEIPDMQIKKGINRYKIELGVVRIKESVNVKQSEQEQRTDPRGDVFTTILNEAQIATLPDDPEAFEQALKDIAGPGAIIRVNGFSDGKLPPKSQIRQIRFRRDSYAAENHELGFVYVDISTKPGLGRWRGGVNFGFADESLNARNAFVPRRAPEQYRRFGLDLSGPLISNKTSLFLSASGGLAYDVTNIFTALPNGLFADQVTRPSRNLSFQTRLEHTPKNNRNLFFEYQYNTLNREQLGVGGYNLSDRAYSSLTTENLVRFGEFDAIGNRLYNEFRAQVRLQDADMRSVSEAPAIIVQNAFNSGGAQISSDTRNLNFDIKDDIDFSAGHHAMRAGARLESKNYRDMALQNQFGTFIFARLADFQDGRPILFTQRTGVPLVRFTQNQLALYWQDDFRVRQGLNISYGLRYELQNNQSDKSNFAPRLGFAYAPFKRGSTTIRGGAGIFYNWFEPSTFEEVLRVDGERQRDIVIHNPGFPDLF
ncbi:MAG: carboxypeptidase regulatory-like domain-containing protein, partial [Pyrinomonadaceae bacterium]